MITLQRLDGRGLYDYRLVEITFKEESGYVEVKLGNTRCVYMKDCPGYLVVKRSVLSKLHVLSSMADA